VSGPSDDDLPGEDFALASLRRFGESFVSGSYTELLDALARLARETEQLAHKHFGYTNGLPALYAARCLVSKHMGKSWDDVVRDLEAGG
jgi:hypothetical protein